MKVIVVTLAMNVMSALAKLFAFSLTMSTSMLSSFIHSCSDCIGQITLILGAKSRGEGMNKSQIYDYGLGRYTFVFVLSVVLFTGAGCCIVYYSIGNIMRPPILYENSFIPMIVLSVALLLGISSLINVLNDINSIKGQMSYKLFVRISRRPDLIVCLFETFASIIGTMLALCGILLTRFTSNVIFDSISSMLIGILLIITGILLGKEVKSLTITEGANEEVLSLVDKSLDILGFNSIAHRTVVYLSAHHLLVAAKVYLDDDIPSIGVPLVINEAENVMRSLLPDYEIQSYIEVEYAKISQL